MKIIFLSAFFFLDLETNSKKILKKYSHFFLFVFILVACKKSTTETVHENHVVSGNQIPNYSGVSTIQVKAYVNRVYVDLLGREADSLELVKATNIIKSGNYNDKSRDSMISLAMNNAQFYPQIFIKTSAVILNSTSKQDIADQINFDNYIRQQSLQTHDTITYNALSLELDALNKLYTVDSMYRLKQIDINEFYRRFIYNYFYDQINMGTQNFVKACFENLFHRNASVNEESNSENMANGFGSYTLFLKTGNCKGDFANIVTHSTEFYQGLIVTAYQNYLLRKPTDQEINSMVTSLSQNKDYLSVVKSIMKTTEYAGF